MEGRLAVQDQSYPLRFLVDTGATGYAFIDRSLVPSICEHLGIEPVPLSKSKRVRGFDGQISPRPLTHCIHPNIILQGHKELTAPLFITDLGSHAAILGKPWMNRFKVCLDMSTDSLRFPDGQRFVGLKPTSQTIEPITVPSVQESQPTSSRRPRILPRPKPVDNDETFSMCSVSAAAFGLIVKRSRQDFTYLYAKSIEEIDSELALEERMKLEALELSSVEASAVNTGELKSQLPSEYHDYLDVFDRAEANKLPPNRPSDHKIELNTDAVPPQSRAYKMSSFKLAKVKEYLTENLSKGFITPSKAAYSSPVLFALKANGDLRFCVDYRKLNALTKRNRYPLPLTDEVIGKLRGCKHLTRLDIIAAFNKIRMHPDSEDLTTFTTALGQYKYRVLPFGLTNGPSTFQQYINEVLWDFLNDFCQAYLDDILIYSNIRSEHRKHVRLVLNSLRKAGLQVDIKKCEFDVRETVFLGVIVSGDGLRMDSKKVETIVNWAKPTNLTETQAFIDFANFYRRFIRDFSKLSKPLIQLTKKDQPFVWSEACQLAFESLKQHVISAPVLRHFHPDKQAILETDASDWVTGGVLSQYDDEGVLHPVAFYSKNMIPAECNYNIYDKELLAIIRCFEHWRPELEYTDLPIQIFTDHQALKTFMENKQLSRRQARYLDLLAEFNFQVIFRSGKMNTKADSLTRRSDGRPVDEKDDRHRHQYQTILTPDRVDIRVGEVEESLFERVLQANKTDYAEYREAVEGGKERLHGVDLTDSRLIDGVLYKQGLLWVPESLQTQVLQEIHDQPASGHPGVTRSIHMLKRHFYWPGCTADVKQYVRNCHPCQRSKAPRNKPNGLLVPLPIPEKRWQDIAMDFITGLPKSEGYNAICTIIDRLTKERHYVPCHWGENGTFTEATVWIMIWNIFRLHGLPDSITSDRGSQFVSKMWKAFCQKLRIKANLSTVYHPETDGQSERANQEVKQGLRLYCNYMQDDWARWIPMVKFADNNNVSSSSSMTPFYLNKGFHPRMSFSPDTTSYASTRERLLVTKAEDIAKRMEEILDQGRSRLIGAQNKMKTQADKHRTDVRFKIGDKVWVSSKDIQTSRPSQTLEDKLLGPYKIIGRVGTSYRLELPLSMKRTNSFHTSKLYLDTDDPLPGQHVSPPRPVIIDEEEEWELDDILASRRHRGRLQYKCKWHGFERDNEWYYADSDNFENAKELLEEFHSRYPQMPR